MDAALALPLFARIAGDRVTEWLVTNGLTILVIIAVVAALLIAFRSVVPRFSPENLAANQVLVDLIKKIAAGKNATPAQIALAWLLTQKPWIVPIPGTRKSERLVENLGAVNLELTPEELRDINSALSKITIVGDRYPKELEKRTGR